MFLYPLVAPANERADGGRRGVENVDAVLLDDPPKAVRLRPIRRAFVHERGRTVRERTVNDIAVSGDPADVRSAPEKVFIADIENVFHRRINPPEKAALGLQNSLRLSGRPA